MKTELLSLEYDIKLINLRIKYSKSLWETIGLTIQIAIIVIEYKKKLYQRIGASKLMKYESGSTQNNKPTVCIVGENKTEEIVLNKETNSK